MFVGIIILYFLFHVNIVFPVLTKIIEATYKSVGVIIQQITHLIEPVFKTVGCRIQCMIKSFLCSCRCFFSSVSSVFKFNSTKSLSPLRTGNYYTNGVWYNQKLIVEGPRAIIKDSYGESYDAKIEIGSFGKTDPEIVEATGEDFFNMKLSRYTVNSQMDSAEYGVVSQDGAKITMKGTRGTFALNWITQEEADALDAEGDPVEAPPCPYKIQPDNPGKLLWMTGQGGTGKSTTAQLLSKNAGYVYYEGDCFWNCKNPYIPLDSPEPGVVSYQKNLVGEGLEARRTAYKKAFESHYEDYKELVWMLCEDIKKERKRIGGDWIVTKNCVKREIRDFVRSCLGPELVLVVLSMEEEEELKNRLIKRHIGDASMTEEQKERMIAANMSAEPVGDDEENVLKVMLTADMTKEDVANKILKIVKQFEKTD